MLCLPDWEERSHLKMAPVRADRYTGPWAFPFFFPDLSSVVESPTITIYLFLNTLTNDLLSRDNLHPTHILELLRAEWLDWDFGLPVKPQSQVWLQWVKVMVITRVRVRTCCGWTIQSHYPNTAIIISSDDKEKPKSFRGYKRDF